MLRQELLGFNNASLFSVSLLIFTLGCAQTPSYKSEDFYDFQLNRGIVRYPYYHPGDWFAGDYENHFKKIRVECTEKCEPIYQCPTERGTLPEARRCHERRNKERIDCINLCIKEEYESSSMARHIHGGYYSDGSYYATYWIGRGDPINNVYPFRNIHPTRLKYEKTKWQKDRDECMEITDEIAKRNNIEYYRECLKERGYEIK